MWCYTVSNSLIQPCVCIYLFDSVFLVRLTFFLTVGLLFPALTSAVFLWKQHRYHTESFNIVCFSGYGYRKKGLIPIHSEYIYFCMWLPYCLHFLPCKPYVYQHTETQILFVTWWIGVIWFTSKFSLVLKTPECFAFSSRSKWIGWKMCFQGCFFSCFYRWAPARCVANNIFLTTSCVAQMVKWQLIYLFILWKKPN